MGWKWRLKGCGRGGGVLKNFFGIFYLLAPVWIYKQIVTFLAYPEDTILGDGWGGVMGGVMGGGSLNDNRANSVELKLQLA